MKQGSLAAFLGGGKPAGGVAGNEAAEPDAAAEYGTAAKAVKAARKGDMVHDGASAKREGAAPSSGRLKRLRRSGDDDAKENTGCERGWRHAGGPGGRRRSRVDGDCDRGGRR